MEKVIDILKEMREKKKVSFIENSIFIHEIQGNCPVPDTREDLCLIIELNKAISLLQRSLK